MVVLDASALVSLLLEDEFHDTAIAMRAAVSAEDVWVPSLLRWELLSALSIAERRKRLSADEVERKIEQVSALGLKVDSRDFSSDMRAELSLARRFNISTYDAAYLELAGRKGAKLMTNDQALSSAAAALGLLWRSG